MMSFSGSLAANIADLIGARRSGEVDGELRTNSETVCPAPIGTQPVVPSSRTTEHVPPMHVLGSRSGHGWIGMQTGTSTEGLASMGWMLEAAGVSTVGLPGLARRRILVLVYLSVLVVFAGDESADLAKTMAALDRRLGLAANFLGI